MGSFVWKKEYSVDVDIIDEQHKKLVATIDRLYDAILARKVKEELKLILDSLVDYSHYHFFTEEKYFDEFHYEHSEEHKASHAAFVAKISEFMKKFENNDIEVSFELIDFLEDWLINHITGEDKQYSGCFHEHGLK